VIDNSQTVTLWKVSVLCEGFGPPRLAAKTRALVRRYTTVLLQATDSVSAMEAARSYAEGNAAPDLEWKVFTPLSATNFVLPIALEDFAA